MSGPPPGVYSIKPAVFTTSWIGVDGAPPLVRVVTEPRLFIIEELELGRYSIRAQQIPGFLRPDDGYIAPKCDEPYGWIISQADGPGAGFTIETWGLMPHQAWTFQDLNIGEPVVLEWLQGSPGPEQKWFFHPYDGSK